MLRSLLALFAVLSTVSAHSQEQLDNPAVGLSRSALSTLVEEAAIPGLQVGVWKEGRLVWSEGFGYANLETRTPVTSTTKFRVASISKAMTGTALARLAAEGRIDLDAPITDYIEDYPPVGEKITARQLASHTAGIRHYRGNEISSTVAYPSLRSALGIFANDDLLFEPGEKYDYTTYGFTLLGAVMEAATEATFFELLRDEVLTPLGMTHTVVDEPRAIIADRASSYELVQGRPVNARPTDHSYKIPGGGMLSTAEDLVRMGAAVMRPGDLDERTIDLIHTPSTLDSGRSVGYSLGWSVRTGDDGPTQISHTGSQPGSTCVLLIEPGREIVVAILCSTRGAPLGVSTAQIVANHFARDYADTTPVSAVGVYEISPEGGATTRVDVWLQGDNYRALATFDEKRIPLPRVHVVGRTIVGHAFDGRLMELEMTLSGDDVKAVLRTGGEMKATGRRVSTEAFAADR